MISTCKSCDQGRHEECDGTAKYIDQDGYSTYICECHCRREINRAREIKVKLHDAQRFLREQGLSYDYEIVEKVR